MVRHAVARWTRDIEADNTGATTDLTAYLYSGHAPSEAMRRGPHGPYAMTVTTGAAPAAMSLDFRSADLPGCCRSRSAARSPGTAAGTWAGSGTVALAGRNGQFWAPAYLSPSFVFDARSLDAAQGHPPGVHAVGRVDRVNPADTRALRDGDLDTREDNLYRLLDRVEQHGDEAAADVLRTLVRDYPDYHRSLYTRAMNRAAVFGDASLEEPLLTALADTRYNCQAWAAMGCAALGIRSAIPSLLGMLDHPQWIAREQAVIGLGELGDESVVPALVPLLGDPADWMRQRTADALAKIGGGTALAALWEEFAHRRFPRIGYIASALALFSPEIIPRLREAAASEDPDQRYWAAVALGSTGDEAAVETLERLMDGDTGSTVFDGRVNVAAKKALRTLRRIQSAIAARTDSS